MILGDVKINVPRPSKYTSYTIRCSFAIPQAFAIMGGECNGDDKIVLRSLAQGKHARDATCPAASTVLRGPNPPLSSPVSSLALGKVAMGWEVEESATALASAGGDVVKAAEALAAQEEEDAERYSTVYPLYAVYPFCAVFPLYAVYPSSLA